MIQINCYCEIPLQSLTLNNFNQGLVMHIQLHILYQHFHNIQLTNNCAMNGECSYISHRQIRTCALRTKQIDDS